MTLPNSSSRDPARSSVIILLIIVSFVGGSLFWGGILAQKKDNQFSLRVPVELVIVPVTVEDKDGNLVTGLTKADFELFVENVPQEITYFSTDPVPLSVAILIDGSLETTTLTSIKSTLTSLVEAFSPFDEISVFQFENTTDKIQDFTFNKDEVLESLKKLSFKSGSGETFGLGPFSGSGGTGDTTINGVVIAPAEAKAPPPKTINTHLNDAIFTAAAELRSRNKERRRIIVVISNGQNAPGNRVSADDTIDAVLHSDIIVFGIAQGNSLFYRKLNALNKFAGASGGTVLFPVRSESLSEAYQRISETARNNYVLGFNPQENVKEPTFRKLSVRVISKQAKAETVRFRKGFYLMPH